MNNFNSEDLLVKSWKCFHLDRKNQLRDLHIRTATCNHYFHLFKAYLYFVGVKMQAYLNFAQNKDL